MNRHERRKQAAQARRSGKPLLVAWKMDEAGRARALAMTADNPAFAASIAPLSDLYVEWRKAHPQARLAWRPMGETFALGDLASPLLQQTLADSPDAFELLAWLAERMPEADVMATRCAIEITDDRIAELVKERTKHTSPGFDLFEAYAHSRGTTTRMADGHCPHCNTLVSAASAGDDSVPEPGQLVVCVACGGLGTYDDQLQPRLMTDDEWAELPPETKTKLEDAGALFRTAAMHAASKGSKGRVDA